MWKIPLCDLRLAPEDHAAVLEALQGHGLTPGLRSQAFEQAFARTLDPARPPHALAVRNGTAALHLALVAVGVGPGDEVIVPSLTFVATANAALYTGATVVLADVNSEEDLTISVDDVLRKITPRTRAIVPVHYAGQPADLLRLKAECQLRGIELVEDAAHAPLADVLVDGQGSAQALGTVGDVGCFSFFAHKYLATGEGGMVVTRRADLADRLHLLRSHGMTTSALDRGAGAQPYDAVELGFDDRMDEVHAALGLSQLRRLADRNRRRADVVAGYLARLGAIPGLVVPFADRLPQGRTAHPILPVLLPPGTSRPAVQDSMTAAGIQTAVHYPPIHTLTFHRDSERVVGADLPVTDALAPRLLTLPLHPWLADADLDLVVRSLALAIAEAAATGGPTRAAGTETAGAGVAAGRWAAPH